MNDLLVKTVVSNSTFFRHITYQSKNAKILSIKIFRTFYKYRALNKPVFINGGENLEILIFHQ